MKTKTKHTLSAYQTKVLDMLSRGYGIAAVRRQFKAQAWREINQLVELGAIIKTPPTRWNRHGSFAAKSTGEQQ